MNVQKLDRQYIAPTYNRFPVTIVSGRGSVVTDEDGKEYIDLGSGIAVNTFGVSDPVWQEAVIAQLGKVQHSSNLYYTAPCALLAEQLCLRTGMRKVFFSNSGAEANECLIKALRKGAADRFGPERNLIVTLENSFHGRTLTTLSATGQERFHALFQPLTPGFVHVPAGDLEALRTLTEQNAGRIAGILIECVQGEGGVIPLEPDYVKGLADLAEEQDILLGVDEVQTGNGRTGALYAYMRYGLKPDVVSTAKGLAGGLPLGATLLGERLAGVFGPGDHGSTFGGNPVCAAAALSVLERIDDALLAEVREKSDYLFRTMQGAEGVAAVAGLGLMIGILPAEKSAAEVVAACRERGVLCLTAKDRVRLLPALNIPRELWERAVGILLECCK